jgi:hypothetical protein
MLLYPTGYEDAPAPDDALFRDLGGALAQSIAGVRGTQYRLLQSVDLYATTGSSLDFAYGRNRQVAFTVEVSPGTCCFDLDETLIASVTGDNVPGAISYLDWAAGPAAVESVRLVQGDTVLYAVHWDRSQSGRTLVFDERAEATAGTVRVEVRFSRPLASTPTLELLAQNSTPLVARAGTPFRYEGDTWVADATLPLAPASVPVRLSVSATSQSAGPAGFDSNPSTLARYATGTGFWSGREGGQDTAYAVLNSDDDFPPRAEFVAPGAEPPGPDGYAHDVFLAGSTIDISWVVTDDRGLASQSLDYSIDGGATFAPLDGVVLGANARAAVWNLPKRFSSAAVVLRLTAIDGGGHRAETLTPNAFAVSRAAVAKPPVYRNGALRIATRKRSLKGARAVRVEIDGSAVDPSRVRAKGDRLSVRGTLADLGLVPGRGSVVRLVVDGVPAPVASFIP